MLTKDNRSVTYIGGGALTDDAKLTVFASFLGEIDRGKVGLLPTASSREPYCLLNLHRKVFSQLGVDPRRLELLPIFSRQDANDAEIVRRLSQLSGVVANGGDQLRAVQVLKGTPVNAALQELPFLGTSASADKQGRRMMWPLMGMRVPISGLGWHDETIIETHFQRKHRAFWLQVATSLYQDSLGIGIDEQMSGRIRGDILTVVGPENQGGVHLYKKGKRIGCLYPRQSVTLSVLSASNAIVSV